MQFDLPKEKSSIIKVIGVGGGGSNAVNHMFKQGIKDVDFIVCNTDRQVLDASPVPLKIQLGAALTEGLGAGSLPEMGRKAALENEDELRTALAKTKMLFITAGMGGGTGTGAAPVIAQIAREMGILTVSICTLPFSWEGKLRRRQAEDGLAELKKHSDSVLVILNDKLREIYHNLKVSEAFAHADNVLSSAAKCIAELINVALRINVDFNDVRRVMETSGVAIMGSAMASGEGRSLKAVTQALNSPLLNDNDIRGARYVLVSITCGIGKDELTMDELGEITEYIQEAAGQTAEMIKGYGTDETLGDKVSVTIIASGFDRKAPELGFETSVQQEMKMVHLDEVKTNVTSSVVEKEAKVEVSKMTEPMLKTEVITDKLQSEVKHESLSVSGIKKQETVVELKKVEKKPVERKHIEVRLDPVVAEVKAEPKVEPVAEVKIAEPVAEVKVEPVQPVAEIPTPIVEGALVVAEIVPSVVITENKIEEVVEEPLPEPFLISKEQEQVSFEFDMTAELPKTTQLEEKIETPVAHKEEAPVMETKVEQKVEAVKPVVNMDVKRGLVNASMTNEPAAESKVTKIADVTLNSQPPITDSEARAKAQEKIQKLRELSFKVKTPGGLAELENEPAYKRKNVMLNDTPHSSESEISRLTLGAENPTNGATNKTPSLRPDNSFLHDKPD
ncbi:MAG: cell division protein FtsZ [Bacteroidetes bacterium]|nr:cell division protein FtsZ [Bacteroidota bacterium]